MAFWQTKDFKRLYQEWEEKLAASKFDDAEEGSLDSRFLKQQSSNAYRSAKRAVREAKAEYFSLLFFYSETHSFRNETDKAIVVARSQGLTMREISKKVGRHWRTIRFILRYYENHWGIKYWKPHQIHPQRKKK